MDNISKLSAWYAKQCNGVWEHGNGIAITTLDNPGWRVKVALADTDMAKTVWNTLRLENSDDDWMQCFRQGDEFHGAGDPGKLNAILDYFLTGSTRAHSE